MCVNCTHCRRPGETRNRLEAMECATTKVLRGSSVFFGVLRDIKALRCGLINTSSLENS